MSSDVRWIRLGTLGLLLVIAGCGSPAAAPTASDAQPTGFTILQDRDRNCRYEYRQCLRSYGSRCRWHYDRCLRGENNNDDTNNDDTGNDGTTNDNGDDDNSNGGSVRE